ncbi:MAG: hypothetical protein AAFY56_12195 [Pseudomonadota bacterium]
MVSMLVTLAASCVPPTNDRTQPERFVRERISMPGDASLVEITEIVDGPSLVLIARFDTMPTWFDSAEGPASNAAAMFHPDLAYTVTQSRRDVSSSGPIQIQYYQLDDQSMSCLAVQNDAPPTAFAAGERNVLRLHCDPELIANNQMTLERLLSF